MLNFIKQKYNILRDSVTSGFAKIFKQYQTHEAFIKDLEALFLTADTGKQTTEKIIISLEKQIRHKQSIDEKELKKFLSYSLINLFEDYKPQKTEKNIYLIVGINGSGKTTFIAKFAHLLKKNNEKILLVAADTFRAGASEQLSLWAQKINVDIFVDKTQKDPSALIFKSCNQIQDHKYSAIIVDTAGRLQTKANLMLELTKMKRIIEKQLPDYTLTTFLTIDAILGQNSLEQAKIFNEATKVNGIILTKLDGSNKSGIIFAIQDVLHIPIAYTSAGENLDSLHPFNAMQYVETLLQ